MLLARPGRARSRPRGRDHEHGRSRRLAHQGVEHLVARGVEPVQVLDQQQHGLARGGREHQLQQRLERLLLALLRRELERRARLVRRQRQRVRQQRHRLGRRPDGLERARQPRALLVRRVRVLEPRQPREHLDHRVQRVARVVRRGAALEQEVGLVAQALAELEQQPRLADAGLSGDQHGLALSFARELEAGGDERQVLVAADERRERRARDAARLRGALAQHPRERHRAAQARQRQLARVVELEGALDQRAGVGAHEHRARLRALDESRGDRRGVAHEAGAGGTGVARDHRARCGRRPAAAGGRAPRRAGSRAATARRRSRARPAPRAARRPRARPGSRSRRRGGPPRPWPGARRDPAPRSPRCRGSGRAPRAAPRGRCPRTTTGCRPRRTPAQSRSAVRRTAWSSDPPEPAWRRRAPSRRPGARACRRWRRRGGTRARRAAPRRRRPSWAGARSASGAARAARSPRDREARW